MDRDLDLEDDQCTVTTVWTQEDQVVNGETFSVPLSDTVQKEISMSISTFCHINYIYTYFHLE